MLRGLLAGSVCSSRLRILLVSLAVWFVAGVSGQVLYAADGSGGAASTAKPNEQRQNQLAELRRHSAQSRKLAHAGDTKGAADEADAGLLLARVVDRDSQELLISWIDFAAAAREQSADFDAAKKLRSETLALELKRFAADDWHVVNARLSLEHLERLSHLSADDRARIAEADKQFADAGKLSSQRKYLEATLPAKRAYDARKAVLSDKDAATATAANRLGFLYNEAADYADARTWNQVAVEMRKTLLGPRNPDYAISINNLGYSYYLNSEYAQAEPWFRQAIEIRKAVLGAKDPDYLDTVDTFCELLSKSAGKHERSEDFVLARKERDEILSLKTDRFGKSDWHVTDARLALAHLDRISQLSPDARKQLADADAAQSKSVGLNTKRQFADAIAEAQKVYDARSKLLGADDPLTAASAHWLGYVYAQSGDNAKAKIWKQKGGRFAPTHSGRKPSRLRVEPQQFGLLLFHDRRLCQRRTAFSTSARNSPFRTRTQKQRNARKCFQLDRTSRKSSPTSTRPRAISSPLAKSAKKS